MKFKLSIIISIVILTLCGCSEVKPLVLPEYKPPDLSKIQRPEIPPLVEGKDYVINDDNTITLKITGISGFDQKILSEEAAWMALATCKNIISIQSQQIEAQRQLIITIDLQRQVSDKKATYADIRSWASAVVAAIFTALVIFAK